MQIPLVNLLGDKIKCFIVKTVSGYLTILRPKIKRRQSRISNDSDSAVITGCLKKIVVC